MTPNDRSSKATHTTASIRSVVRRLPPEPQGSIQPEGASTVRAPGERPCNTRGPDASSRYSKNCSVNPRSSFATKHSSSFASGTRMDASHKTRPRNTSMDQDRSQTTRLLKAVHAGDHAAAERLLPLVYAELHRVANAYMRRERPDHTLQPTALINEAYLRLIRGGRRLEQP